MKILFVAPEIYPIIKIGGLADVVGALSKEITKKEHDARVVIPFYFELKNKINNIEKIGEASVSVNKKKEHLNIFQTKIKTSSPEQKQTEVIVYLIENEKYLSSNGVYLDNNNPLAVLRFLFFSLAVLKIFKIINWKPDIVHCNDWQTSIIPFLLKIKNISIKSILTVHNLFFQGKIKQKIFCDFLEIKKKDCLSLKKNSLNVNVLEQGILLADLITTVSPQYAKEITKQQFSLGLRRSIKKRARDISGILNGIDQDIYNPITDKFLKKNYSIKTIEDKQENKLYLQEKLGLKIDKDIPLLAIVSRISKQKGLDLILSSFNKIIKLNCQLVLLGTGNKDHEQFFLNLSKENKSMMATLIGFDSILAHQIYAGADIFLMPSRFEPCGLSQMMSMRYGTIPLVRSTGGLKDTVKNFKIKKSSDGTGFVFKIFSVKVFLFTLKRALNIYYKKNIWRKIQVNAMKKNFSWENPTIEYIKLYKKLLTK